MSGVQRSISPRAAFAVLTTLLCDADGVVSIECSEGDQELIEEAVAVLGEHFESAAPKLQAAQVPEAELREVIRRQSQMLWCLVHERGNHAQVPDAIARSCPANPVVHVEPGLNCTVLWIDPQADAKPHVNVGTLAHVDNGKAALTYAIASLSTAPQADYKPKPYGYCPRCGAAGVRRERRPGGNDVCANDHTYKSGSGLKEPATPQAAQVPSLHPRTADLVQRFAAALAEKLAAAEAKYGYSEQWAEPDWMDECRAKLVEHVAKGDPRDVAAYCAFLWHHGERTAMPSPQAAQVPEGPEAQWLDRLKWATERRLTRDYRTVTLGENECRQVLSALADARDPDCPSCGLGLTPATAQVPDASARLRDGLWVFSSNDEVFRSEEFDSEQDAVSGALSYGYDEEDRIYVGQVKLLNVRRMIGNRVESMLEWVGEDAGEEVGESADDWPSLSRERINELQKMVADFILTHSPAPFYMVENVRSYSNAEAEAMLAAAQAQGVSGG